MNHVEESILAEEGYFGLSIGVETASIFGKDGSIHRIALWESLGELMQWAYETSGVVEFEELAEKCFSLEGLN